MFKYGVVLLATIWGLQGATKQLVGPYDVVFHKIYECSGLPTGPNIMKLGKTFENYNKTAILYSNNITIPNGVRDSMQGIVDLSIQTNKGWRKNYFNIRFNKLCTELVKMFPTFLSTLMKAAGSTYTGCPVKPGTYNVKNWTVDLQTSTGMAPYNSYKIETSVMEFNRKVGCFTIEIDVIPKV